MGHLFNWALLGILAIQVYIYSLSFREDKLAIKALVALLFFLDLLQTAFATHYAWYVLAGGWGDLYVLNYTPWTLTTISPLSGSIALLVQGFFSWRIWVLAQGNKVFLPILALIGITSFGACVAAWYAGIASSSMRNVAKASLLDPEVTGWLAGNVAADSMITITLVWQLSRRRNKGFSKVNHVVHRAIRMSIETGALTTVATAIELALFLNSSVESWYFLPGMSIAKLYSNSLLATLNSRSHIFQNQGTMVSVNGAHMRANDSRGESTITTSFPDSRKKDIELGRVQIQQDITRHYDSKPEVLSIDPPFPAWK